MKDRVMKPCATLSRRAFRVPLAGRRRRLNGNLTIDGKAWASPVPSAMYRNSLLSVSGLDLGLSTTVTFAVRAPGPGTYSLAFGNTVGGFSIVVKGNQSWSSVLTGGTG